MTKVNTSNFITFLYRLQWIVARIQTEHSRVKRCVIFEDLECSNREVGWYQENDW